VTGVQTCALPISEIAKLDRGFAVEASAWRVASLDDGAEADRAAAGEDALRSLTAAVQTAVLELDRAHSADWTRLQALTQRSSPDEILRHVERFECGHLADWTAAVSGQLELELVKHGVLQVDALCKSELLDSWEHAESGGAALGDWLAARNWYCGDEDAPAGVLTPLAKVEPSTPHSDWRATLNLQRSFAASTAFPLPAGWIAVWHDADLMRKTSAWYVDELVAESGDGDKRNWEIRRAVYVGDGLTPSNAQRVVLARRGAEFTRSGKPILGLDDHGEMVKVGAWHVDRTLTPPAKSWFPSQDEIATFRTEVAKGDVPALVTSDGTMTRWFSPDLGLVREEAPGVFRMELVYLGPKR
jgi:hypothetical protein